MATISITRGEGRFQFDSFCTNNDKVCFHFYRFQFSKPTKRASLMLLHKAPHLCIWDTVSGAPSHFLAHILILLTKFSSPPPQFLFFLHSLTNPKQADSGTKIWHASKRQLERFDFRSRRRRQNFWDPFVSHDLMRRESAAFVLCLQYKLDICLEFSLGSSKEKER